MSAPIPRNPMVGNPRRTTAPLQTVVELQGAALLRRARKLTHTRADALDLLQDTLLRALQHGVEYVPEEKTAHWLFVVMTHLHIDSRRKAKNAVLVPLDESNTPSLEPFAPTDTPLWQSFGYDDVQRCLKGLSPRVREAYLLHEEQGLTLAATAQRLCVPIATAGTRVYRARRRLRELLLRPNEASDAAR